MPQWRPSTFFPWRERHSSRGKKAAGRPSSAALRLASASASPIASGLSIAIEAAMGAAR